MEQVINSSTKKQKVQDEDQFLASLKKKIEKGKPKVRAKYSDEMLQKVQFDRIETAKRKAGDANIRDLAKRERLKELLMTEALNCNLRELNRQRGLDMTLSQYRASIGL